MCCGAVVVQRPFARNQLHIVLFALDSSPAQSGSYENCKRPNTVRVDSPRVSLNARLHQQCHYCLSRHEQN